jgi:hypothetical protein
MNKQQLSAFSLEIRELLNKERNTNVAEREILHAGFSVEEEAFVFNCLKNGKYNLETGLFITTESDNVEFLKLVDIVQKKIQNKRSSN